MKNVTPKNAQRQPQGIESVVVQPLPIPEEVGGQQQADCNRQLLDLIHITMRLRQLEFNILGRYVRIGDAREAEKQEIDALAKVLQAPGPVVPPTGVMKAMMAPGSRCPVGFHEQDGRCVPD